MSNAWSGTTSGGMNYVASTFASVQPFDVSIDFYEPIVTRCAKEGHRMHRECELEDGTLAGLCEHCGELIKGRRLAGGFALARLRAAVESVLCSDKELVAGEFLRLAAEIDAEEKALREAKSLLRLAERALLARTS